MRAFSCVQTTLLRGMQCRFGHSGSLSRELRSTGKVGNGASNPGWETMIRPICAVLAITCLSAPAFAETCVASRYGYGGGRTASGERMNPNAMTAAHRARPFGSHVTVTSHSTGRSVTVRINDRGPFVKGRCIDLSTGAARVLGFSGTAMVSLR
jgi:rare lipoprotein A